MSGTVWAGWADSPATLRELRREEVRGSVVMRCGSTAAERDAGEQLARSCGSYIRKGTELVDPDDYDVTKWHAIVENAPEGGTLEVRVPTLSLDQLGRDLPFGFQISALPESPAVDPADLFDLASIPRDRRAYVVKQLQDAGYMLREIGDLFGVVPSTVSNWLKKLDG